MKHKDGSEPKPLIIPEESLKIAMENARILKEELYKIMKVPKNLLK